MEESLQAHSFFLTLLTILLAARILGEVAARLQAPGVIGELLAGVVLGPSVLAWIEPTHTIKLLAEVGVILLLFEVGLETDVMRLVRAGGKSTIVATTGFVAPFVLGFGLSYFAFQQDLLVALFIGGTLTATSIGITLRVLHDLGRQQGPEARIILGAAVLDDVLGVVLLALLYEFSQSGGINLAAAGKVLLFVVLFMALAPFAAKLMSEVIRRYDRRSRIPGLIPTTVVSLVLFFAWLANVIGAPELLGGLAAGLALSRQFFFPLGMGRQNDRQFVARVEEKTRPIIQLFTPIFFVTVGLSLNLREIDWSSGFIWAFSLSLLAVAIAGKVLSAWLVREPWSSRVAIGLAMVPRGEVGLIFAELGRSAGIFDNEIYAAMIIVIALSTLLPPFALKWFYARYAPALPKV